MGKRDLVIVLLGELLEVSRGGGRAGTSSFEQRTDDGVTLRCGVVIVAGLGGAVTGMVAAVVRGSGTGG